MKKDFDNWNTKKKEINKALKPCDFYFHEREKWWCSLGINIGYEQDGKNENFERPVLVLRKFNRDIALITPLTSVAKENQYHHKLNTGDSFVILSQIRLISAKRLLRKIEVIGENEFKEITNKIKRLF
jgi:mRNA interferase MazF